MRHTPEPWKVIKSSQGLQVVSDSAVVVTIDLDLEVMSKRERSEREGDAHLIAAALEMYEACKETVATFDEVGCELSFAGVYEQLRAAIAKVEGGAQ